MLMGFGRFFILLGSCSPPKQVFFIKIIDSSILELVNSRRKIMYSKKRERINVFVVIVVCGIVLWYVVDIP